MTMTKIFSDINLQHGQVQNVRVHNYDNLNSLPLLSKSERGEVAFVVSEKKFYGWVGNNWKEMGSSSGGDGDFRVTGTFVPSNEDDSDIFTLDNVDATIDQVISEFDSGKNVYLVINNFMGSENYRISLPLVSMGGGDKNTVIFGLEFADSTIFVSMFSGGCNGEYHDADAEVEEVDYEQLKSMKAHSELKPGSSYRITDYDFTLSPQFISTEKLQSAHRNFDIIVTAIDINILDENAKAIVHDGDSYFATSNLNAWELKYCFDNDTDRFDYIASDGEGGKGFIYYMKDEFNNEANYDFKNAQYLDSSCNRYVYTFDYDGSDMTVNCPLCEVRNNKITQVGACFVVTNPDVGAKYQICNNEFDTHCHKNIFYLNTGGVEIKCNKFNGCVKNMFINMHDMHDNTFNNNCSENTFDTSTFVCSTICNNFWKNSVGWFSVGSIVIMNDVHYCKITHLSHNTIICGGIYNMTINDSSSSTSQGRVVCVNSNGDLRIGSLGDLFDLTSDRTIDYISSEPLPDVATRAASWISENTDMSRNEYDITTGVGRLYLNPNVTSIGSDAEAFDNSTTPFHSTKMILVDFSNSGIKTIKNNIVPKGNYATVKIPSSVSSIYTKAFYSVKLVDYDGTLTDEYNWGASYLNGYVEGDFVYNGSNKKELISYTGNDSYVYLDLGDISINGAFLGCQSIEKVEINSVGNIVGASFYKCPKLSEVIFVPTEPPSYGGQFVDGKDVTLKVYDSSAIYNYLDVYGKMGFKRVTYDSWINPKSELVLSGDFNNWGEDECAGIIDEYHVWFDLSKYADDKYGFKVKGKNSWEGNSGTIADGKHNDISDSLIYLIPGGSNIVIDTSKYKYVIVDTLNSTIYGSIVEPIPSSKSDEK